MNIDEIEVGMTKAHKLGMETLTLHRIAAVQQREKVLRKNKKWKPYYATAHIVPQQPDCNAFLQEASTIFCKDVQ